MGIGRLRQERDLWLMTETMVSEFEASMEKDFGFLKAEHGYDSCSVRSIDDDPRDAYLLARFTKEDMKIDIAWNEMAKSLSILIRLANVELGRNERYVYFEPFIEFLSKGQVLPIAPQLFPRMTMKSTESVMRQRNEVFQEGIASTLVSLSQKLREYLGTVQSASTETIRAYHSWYETRTDLSTGC
jgi:hypothetical protein